MKKMAFLLLVVLLVSVSCNNVPSGSAGLGELRDKIDSLNTVVAKLNEEFNILKFGLEKRGLSIEQMRAEMEVENKVWDIPIGQSPFYGNANALITIVEFSEFQCPYCARIAPYMDTLMHKYPDKIKLVYKHFPLNFHKDASSAAAASMAAQAQGKFWEFRYALAPHFKTLTPEIFVEVAKKIGLNVERFKKDMALDMTKQARLNEDMQLGQRIGVNGTPNFYVNGKKMDRFSPEAIEDMVRQLK